MTSIPVRVNRLTVEANYHEKYKYNNLVARRSMPNPRSPLTAADIPATAEEVGHTPSGERECDFHELKAPAGGGELER